MAPEEETTKRFPYAKLIWISVLLLAFLVMYSYEHVVYAVFPVLPNKLQLSITTHIIPNSSVSALPVADKFRSGDSYEREFCFQHLHALKGHAADAVPLLADEISATDRSKNYKIFCICTNAGPSALKHLKPLILGQSQAKAEYALAATAAIARDSKGDIDEVIPEIFQLLKSTDDRRTHWIPQILETTKGRYVPRLISALKNKSERSTAMYCLGRIGHDARDAVPELATDLINKDP
ncbi:MAG: hypothetical protein P1V97_09345, partial [Planctomycetota bacterium]|nr:hypothetical protein [Planctomycetota bacterium]